jgi:hypothetical protein
MQLAACRKYQSTVILSFSQHGKHGLFDTLDGGIGFDLYVGQGITR